MPEKDIYATLVSMADPKNFSKDMAVILVWVALTVAMIYVPVLNETFLRVIFAVPVILFIPGYVLIAAISLEKFFGSAILTRVAYISFSGMCSGSICREGLSVLCLSFCRTRRKYLRARKGMPHQVQRSSDFYAVCPTWEVHAPQQTPLPSQKMPLPPQDEQISADCKQSQPKYRRGHF